MSEPKKAEAVKLVASILFTEKTIVTDVLENLTGEYGNADFISYSMPFSYTDYYCHEMGFPLERRFVAFARLILPESLPDIKLRTNAVEKMFALADGRRVNIDPGYLSRAHLILATGKGYAHRPYLRDGIYADLTLIYADKSFQTVPWTYPDYGEKTIREMFTKIRSKYVLQLKRGDLDATGIERSGEHTILE